MQVEELLQKWPKLLASQSVGIITLILSLLWPSAFHLYTAGFGIRRL